MDEDFTKANEPLEDDIKELGDREVFEDQVAETSDDDEELDSPIEGLDEEKSDQQIVDEEEVNN